VTFTTNPPIANSQNKNHAWRCRVHIVRSLQSTQQISNPVLRELVQQRINDLGGEAFDTDALGYFVVIEPGDTIEAIHAQVGFNILHNRFSGIRFNATGFTPSFEFIEEFPACYDMVFVLDDSGIGIELFVLKEEGIDTELIAMCQMYAYPAPPEDAP
jgi:hypothetical protein